ncbi:MAG: MmgE/PrpD family protein [Acidimicrobiales bacterium]
MLPVGHTIEEMADWIQSVSAEDMPADVIELAQAQRRSVLAAVFASLGDESALRVLEAVRKWASPGNVPLVGTGELVRTEDALYGAAALSIALDFDDYLCFAHTGHSAVLVPLMVACETGSTGNDQLVAQVIVNELAGRLGGACLIGRQNGQMWSFVHAAGSAAASARLMGLTRCQTAHALALALYAPPRATAPGFFMPDSKLVTASEPITMGLRAARLAAAGVTGPLDTLDSKRGFLGTFSEAPLKGALGGLGEGWTTRTLSVKAYPGCAYVDTMVDAILSLPVYRTEDISSVRIETNLLSYVMDLLARPYTLPEHTRAARVPVRTVGWLPTPVTVNFSLAWTAAVTLASRGLSPLDLRRERMAEHAEDLQRIVAVTRTVHDPSLTEEAVSSFEGVLPRRLVVSEVGLAGLLRAGVGLEREQPEGLSEWEIARVASKILKGTLRGTVRRAVDIPGEWQDRLKALQAGGLKHLIAAAGHDRDKVASGRAEHVAQWWQADALESFTMRFPSRVIVRMKDGSEMRAAAAVPLGAAGNRVAGPAEIAKEKLATHAVGFLGEDGAKRLDRAITENASDLATYLAL